MTAHSPPRRPLPVLALAALVGLGPGCSDPLADVIADEGRMTVGSAEQDGSTVDADQDGSTVDGGVEAIELRLDERIGPGRIIDVAEDEGVLAIATTSQVVAESGGVPTGIPTTLIGSVEQVRVVADGRGVVVAGAGSVELWRLGERPQLSWSQSGASAFDVWNDGVVVVDPTSIRLVSVVQETPVVAESATTGGDRRIDASPDGGVVALSSVGDEARANIAIWRPGSPLGEPSWIIDGVVERIAVAGDRVLIAHTSLAGDASLTSWRTDAPDPSWTTGLGIADPSTGWEVEGDGPVWLVAADGLSTIGGDGSTTPVAPLPSTVVWMRAVDAGRTVQAVTSAGDVVVVDGSGDLATHRLGARQPIAVSPAGDGVLVVDHGGVIHIHAADGAPVSTDRRYAGGPVLDLDARDASIARALGDGSVIVSGSDPARGDGSAIGLFHPEGPVTAVDFSADGRHVATGVAIRRTGTSFDDTVRTWLIDGAEPQLSVGGEAEPNPLCTFFTNVVRYTHDGSRILATSHDFGLRVIDATTGELVHEFPPHAGAILDFAISTDDRLVVTVADDSTFRVWDLLSNELVAEHPTGPGGFLAVAFAPGRDAIVATDLAGNVQLVDFTTGAASGPFHGRVGRETSLAVSSDGTLVAAGGPDDGVLMWTLPDGRLAARGGVHVDAVTAVAFSDDGRRLISGSLDGTVAVWSIDASDDPVSDD